MATTADKTSITVWDVRSQDECPFPSWALLSPSGYLHVVPGLRARWEKIVSHSGERRGGIPDGGGARLPLRTARRPMQEADAVHCPPVWCCAEVGSFCLSPFWIPLEYLTLSQPTSNPGTESAPFISTRSSASSVLSCGCKLQRHFLFQVVSSRKPGSVGCR